MHDDREMSRGPLLGEPAPFFEAEMGGHTISLRDFKGRWVIIFTDPEELLPVFKTRTVNYVLCRRKTKVIALGRRTGRGTTAGRNPVKKYILRHNLTFIDDAAGKIAEMYGLSPTPADRMEKGIFIIDPKGMLRAKLYQPQDAGRNFYDMIRLVDALRATDGRKARDPETGGWRQRLDIVIRPKAATGQGSAG